jgi:hypothetical protein
MNRFLNRTIQAMKLAGLMLIAAHLGQAQTRMQVVDVHVMTETDAVHADSETKVAVVAEIAAGYHINNHKPTLDYLIPTKFELTPTDQFQVKSVVYPKGSPIKFPFSDVPLSVYEGKLVVPVLLQVAKSVAPGTYPLKVKFRYQACSEHACLPPASAPVEVELRVVAPNVPLKVLEKNAFQRIKFE